MKNCRHLAERTRLQNDIEGLKELLHTYEQSIERKDQVIGSLTQGLQQQRQKHEMLKTFCEWKMRHNDIKREVCHYDILVCCSHNGSKKCILKF